MFNISNFRLVSAIQLFFILELHLVQISCDQAEAVTYFANRSNITLFNGLQLLRKKKTR